MGITLTFLRLKQWCVLRRSLSSLLRPDSLLFTPSEEPVQIRITVCSGNMKSLEEVCADLIRDTKKTSGKVEGPVHMRTETLRLTTRKIPCGEGSKTWDYLHMRIPKRLIDLHCPSEIVTDYSHQY